MLNKLMIAMNFALCGALLILAVSAFCGENTGEGVAWLCASMQCAMYTLKLLENRLLESSMSAWKDLAAKALDPVDRNVGTRRI